MRTQFPTHCKADCSRSHCQVLPTQFRCRHGQDPSAGSCRGCAQSDYRELRELNRKADLLFADLDCTAVMAFGAQVAASRSAAPRGLGARLSRPRHAFRLSSPSHSAMHGEAQQGDARLALRFKGWPLPTMHACYGCGNPSAAILARLADGLQGS